MSTDHECFDDARRLLGVLALQLMTTDDSVDAAFTQHLQSVSADLDPWRQAVAWELIAAITMGLAIGELGPDRVQWRVHTLDSGDIVQQECVFYMIKDHLLADEVVEIGHVTRSLGPVFEHDPYGLAWALFGAATGACGSLALVGSIRLGVFDQLGDGDLEPAGITRCVLDSIALALEDLAS